MTYDHIIGVSETLNEARYHLACGYYTTTSFLFEKANFSVVIDCCGDFTFYTVGGEKIETIKAKRMLDGRERYMDVFISTTEDGVTFKLPDYQWTDYYPHCDGESDRWDGKVIGILDEVHYPAVK